MLLDIKYYLFLLFSFLSSSVFCLALFTRLQLTKKCCVHLKHWKMETSYYKLLFSLMFFSLCVKGTEFLTFHLHIVLLPSPGINS